jgi:hypothetical protein
MTEPDRQEATFGQGLPVGRHRLTRFLGLLVSGRIVMYKDRSSRWLRPLRVTMMFSTVALATFAHATKESVRAELIRLQEQNGLSLISFDGGGRTGVLSLVLFATRSLMPPVSNRITNISRRFFANFRDKVIPLSSVGYWRSWKRP